MAAFYLITCVLLAVSLSASNRWARVAGTLTAAAALFMISLSIALANFDETFASFRSHDVLDRSKPVVLNLQASIGLGASLFLLWATIKNDRFDGRMINWQAFQSRGGSPWASGALILVSIREAVGKVVEDRNAYFSTRASMLVSMPVMS